MKNKRGLRFLLLAGDINVSSPGLQGTSRQGAALVSAFSLWFLTVNSAPTDIFLLLTSRTSVQPKTESGAYTSSTFETPDIKSDFVNSNTTGATSTLIDPEEVVYSRGFADNSTLSDWITTQSADTASPQNNINSTSEPRTSISESYTSTDSYTQEVLPTQDVNSSQDSTPHEKQTLEPGLTTARMGDNQTVCLHSTGLTEAEVLAITIGGVFFTILLSALFYQFAAYVTKKKAKRDSSVYIIENELHKYDIEANGDTRL